MSSFGVRPHNYSHGMSRTAAYKRWQEMRNRCNNPNADAYHKYGGRGIKVCDRWQGRDGFIRFVEDMGAAPTSDHSIDRIDNNGDYEPGNCRWATSLEQAMNRRTNKCLTMNGVTLTQHEWAKKVGITAATICKRLKRGWTVDDALTVGARIQA